MKDYIKKSFFRLLFAIVVIGCFYYGHSLMAYANEWRQAIGPWKWVFPRDHGSHPEFRTEWWYFTGNLTDPSKKRFGYQLTFFRQGVFFKAKEPTDPWAIRDVYLAHFTLTDVSSNQFWYADRASRKGPGLADASEEGMKVWLLNWRAKMEGEKIKLEARHHGMELSLDLVPRKPLVFHGKNGLSQKGPMEGQASYYFSYTNLEAKGVIKTPGSQTPTRVEGISWFDHEFGSNQLAPDQIGWDWFSLHLSDGRDLMIYFLRRKDGTAEPSSSGTLVTRSGDSIHLKLSEINVEVLDHWKSPRSGGKYPSRWRLKIPRAKIDLEISSLVPSQELLTEGSTGVIYWEGAIAGKGTAADKPVTCEGYVELTGYAGSLGGIF
ncbi:MAG: lipocalin-like domain-containing protein [Thermodesulfobacteriota bacterium]